MDTVFWGALVLAIFLVGFTGWRGVPLLVSALAPGQIKSWFLAATEIDALLASTPTAQVLLSQLQALGFDLLGIRAEKVLWRKPTLEVAVASAAKNAFASIVLAPNGKAADIYFYTPLVGGGLVLTRSKTPHPEMENDNTSVKNMPSASVDQLWTAHTRRGQRFRQRGMRPLAADGPAARLEAAQYYYTTAYAKRVGRATLRSAPARDFYLALALVAGMILIYLWRTIGPGHIG